METYRKFAAGSPGIKHVIMLNGEADGCLDYEELVGRSQPLAGSVREWGEDEMLDLCYTGGTTGLPKGVMLTQRNVVSNAITRAMLAEFEETRYVAARRADVPPRRRLGLLRHHRWSAASTSSSRRSRRRPRWTRSRQHRVTETHPRARR